MGAGCPQRPIQSEQECPAGGTVASRQRLLETLLRNAPLAVIEWDASFRVTNWSGNAAEMFGWQAEEVLGKNPFEWPFVCREDWRAVGRAMDSMRRGERGVSRNGNLRKDGKRITCEWHNSVLLDDSGIFLGGLSLVFDLSDSEQKERALQASEEKFREIVELAPVGIFRSTADGQLLSVNPRLAEMFGYESGDAMMERLHRDSALLYASPDTRAEIVERALANQNFIETEVEYRRGDGSVFTGKLQVRAACRQPDKVESLEGFVEDITEQRSAAQMLLESNNELERRVAERTAELSAANERLKELDRLKNHFLASVTHELRTPMNSILGFTRLLRQGASGTVTAEQTRQLAIIESSADRLLELINDLLDVSRIEAGRAELEHFPFDFGDVLSEVSRLVEPLARRKGLDWVARAEPPSILMTGDRRRTLQVLLKLADNAVKFTARGQVCITATAGQDRLQVEVVDTGIGIRPAEMERLFEVFHQLDGSVQRGYEGTGLGLHFCRKLVTLMGGEITVESQYGRGSRFCYTIPRVLAPTRRSE